MYILLHQLVNRSKVTQALLWWDSVYRHSLGGSSVTSPAYTVTSTAAADCISRPAHDW